MSGDSDRPTSGTRPEVWEDLRRKTSHLAVLAEQFAVIVSQLAEAIEGPLAEAIEDADRGETGV